jgi:hypothetical protein
MLKMISWMSFLTWTAILVGAYYLLVFVRYYHRELIGLFSGKTSKADSSVSEEQRGDKKPELFTAMEKAISALKEGLQEVEAAGTKDDVLDAAKGILRNYNYLKGTPYAVAIDHFLLQETYQSVRLNEDELKGLWD